MFLREEKGGKKMSYNENKSEKQGCCCGTNNCNCGSNSCGPKKGSGCDMADKMMFQAEKAWEGLMRQKLQAEFEKAMGPQMDTIASVLAKISIEKHTHMMEGKQKCEESKAELKKAFTSAE
jgi:hypothetical protein